MNKSELKQIIKEEIHKVLNEITVNTPSLFQFVKINKKEIAKLNPEYEKIIMNSGIEKLSPDLWTEEDYYSSYEDKGYSYDEFMKDWNIYNPEVIMLGEELATVFVTDKPLPKEFANTLSGNDTVFYGTEENKNNAFKKYNVAGKTLYIVWGIPDPGS
jgi:hypothetical protein